MNFPADFSQNNLNVQSVPISASTTANKTSCSNHRVSITTGDRKCEIPTGCLNADSPPVPLVLLRGMFSLSRRHGLRFEDSKIWVIHRHQEYGPFDYEWSLALDGIELTYQGQKFGEYCNSREFFADLSEFNLPTSVYSVATIALGTLIMGLLNGKDSNQRESLILHKLQKAGFSKYATEIDH